MKKPCTFYLKTVCTKQIPTCKKCQSYFSDMVWKEFASVMDLTNKRNKKLNFFADSILIKINCNRKLSLNKMTYCHDLVIHFDKIYDIDCRGKKIVIDA